AHGTKEALIGQELRDLDERAGLFEVLTVGDREAEFVFGPLVERRGLDVLDELCVAASEGVVLRELALLYRVRYPAHDFPVSGARPVVIFIRRVRGEDERVRLRGDPRVRVRLH